MSALALRAVPVSAEDRFDDLFRGYYSRARGLARWRFPDLDAEEIAQEAMLRVLTHVDSIDSRRNPWPYIATITMNVGRDMARSLRPTMELDEKLVDVPVAPGADEAVLLAEIDDELKSALVRMSPAGRQVLTLHAYGDMSIGQIAAFLGCNDNAVRQKLFRARRQFLRVLDEVLAASAAAIGVLGWVIRRSGARRSGRVVVPASAMTLSAAVFAVLGVATIQVISATGTTPAPVTTRVAMNTHSSVDVHPAASQRTSSMVPAVAPATAPIAAAVGPAEVAVSTPGSLLRAGKTNDEHIVLHTAAGDLSIGNSGQNDAAEGKVCRTGLIACQ
jgi:RNA polymerase sigma-70 factor (ECF subfamily)